MKTRSRTSGREKPKLIEARRFRGLNEEGLVMDEDVPFYNKGIGDAKEKFLQPPVPAAPLQTYLESIDDVNPDTKRREHISPPMCASELWYAFVAQQLKPKDMKLNPKAQTAMQDAWKYIQTEGYGIYAQYDHSEK